MSSERLSHAEHTDSRVRRRVVQHMGKLLVQGAAGAAVTIGCTGGCDPVPPPATVTCADLATADPATLAYADAQWLTDASGALVLKASASLRPPLTVSGTLTATGATVSDVLTGPSGPYGATLSFTAVPDAGVSVIQVSVPVRCEQSDRVLLLSIQTAPAAGDHAKVTLSTPPQES